MSNSFGRRLQVVTPPGSAGAGGSGAGSSGSASTDLIIPSRGEEGPAPGPARSDAATATLTRLRQQVLERVDPVSAGSLSAEQLREEIGKLIHELADRDRLDLSGRVQTRLVDELVDEMIGNGPLEPLLRDEKVDDILVNGPNRVFVEIAGKMQLSSVRFRDNQQLAGIAQKTS